MRLGMVSGLAGRPAFTHRLCQRCEILSAPWTGQEVDHRGEAGRRMAVQKSCGVLGERILVVCFCQEFFHREVIAQNSHAALRRPGFTSQRFGGVRAFRNGREEDRKSTRLNSSHPSISYAVFCLKKKNKKKDMI